MDFSNITIHCSSLSRIMTNPRGKSYREQYNEALESLGKVRSDLLTSNTGTKAYEKLAAKVPKLSKQVEKLKPLIEYPNLSQTCKSHLQEIYVELKYKRKKDIQSKYLEKGTLVEEDSITNVSVWKNILMRKNKIFKQNDYIQGTADIVDPYIIDIKSAWDAYTFRSAISSPLVAAYRWQVKGYMWLWNIDKGSVCYSLVNTPRHLVEKEKNFLMYDMFGNKKNYDYAGEDLQQQYDDLCADIDHSHVFEDIPIEERCYEFEVERDHDDESAIIERVEDCRKYLNLIENNLLKEVDDEEKV